MANVLLRIAELSIDLASSLCGSHRDNDAAPVNISLVLVRRVGSPAATSQVNITISSNIPNVRFQDIALIARVELVTPLNEARDLAGSRPVALSEELLLP